ASAVYAVTRDPALLPPLDEAVAAVRAAQRPDGYLHTRVQIHQRQGDPVIRPFRDPLQFEAYTLGHLLTAACVHHRAAGRTDLLLETGDPTLRPPLTAVWDNVVREKLYVTGGCGALYDGASPDGAKDQKHIARVHQAYGRDYQLPNTTAHNETCAAVGL